MKVTKGSNDLLEKDKKFLENLSEFLMTGTKAIESYVTSLENYEKIQKEVSESINDYTSSSSIFESHNKKLDELYQSVNQQFER